MIPDASRDINRRAPCCVLALLVATFWGPSVGCVASTSRFEFSQTHMGAPFKIVLHATDAAAAHAAAEAAFHRIAELDVILSDYDGDSELNALLDAPPGDPVPVGEDLFRVLQRAGELSRKTQGAFDVTVGPLVRLWRRSSRQGVLPSARRLAAARARVGHEKIRLDAERRTVTLLAPVRIDLGAIGKGYAAQEALAILDRRGCPVALVDGGGDLAIGESPPGTHGWRIGLFGFFDSDGRSRPDGQERAYLLQRTCVATSGDTERAVTIDGVRYSHIVDPRTGLGVTPGRLVTVIATDGAVADGLASALSVAAATEALEILAQFPGSQAWLRWRDGEELEEVVSPGFPRPSNARGPWPDEPSPDTFDSSPPGSG